MGAGKGGGQEVDGQEAAQAQAQFNRLDQTTPFGSLKFSGENRAQSTITLSPEQQALLEPNTKHKVKRRTVDDETFVDRV